ncbi:MAG TPA: hypothetical protein VFZ76_13105 [Anaerolineales bacterium]
MDKNPFSERALTFGLATFHTVIFIIIVVLFLYSQGTLGALLEGLNTLAGYVIFGALWATTWWTTRKALRGYLKGLNHDGKENWIAEMMEGELELDQVIANGVIWGGVNGFLFLIALALILLIYILVLTLAALLSGSTNPEASVTLILFALIGSPVGAIVGGVVGFILALVDGAILGLVRWLI